MTTDKPGRREPPYSLRLTIEQRAWLRDRAGRASLGTYIKSVLFSDSTVKPSRRVLSRVKDATALAEVLACLGASRIANNLNQLAKASNIGSFYFDEETKRQLDRACEDIRVMRLLLLQALGEKESAGRPPRESVSQSMARAAKNTRFAP